MPSDIRSFFGGTPAPKAPAQEKESSKKTSAKKGSRSRKTLDDSDDEVTAKKPSPKKAAPKKREPTPEGEATNASDYFGSSKPKKSAAAVRSSTSSKKATDETPKASPAKTASAKATPSGRASSRKKSNVNYADDGDDKAVKAEEDEEFDDVFHAEFKSSGKGLGDDYEEDEDDDIKPARKTAGRGRQAKLKEEDDFEPEQEDVDMKDANPEDDFVVPDEDEHVEVDKPAKTTKANGTAARKRKSKEMDEDDEEEDVKPKKARATKSTSAPKKSAKKDKDEPEDATAKAIFDSIPLVRPPSPPAKGEGEAKKFTYGAPHANSGPPPEGAIHPNDMPVGAENCLAGLSFVFTGLLSRLGREDGQALVKRYGGKIMSAPSGKTSFVVLGSDAGPKKLEVIKKFSIKTINEDGLFELIRKLPANGGNSKAAAAHEEKKQKEEEKIKQMAEEAEKAERRAGGAGGAGIAPGKAAKDKAPVAGPDTRLWTVKHAPSQLSQICGNKSQVEKLQKWLHDFPKNLKRGFKMGGPEGSGLFRAVMIHGPPGIGKTTAAHLVAKLEGYDVVESNASDTRSKKLVETGLKGVLDTTSLAGYFSGDGQEVQSGKKKLCLIMDEVDGMSAGDRGGVGALAAVCRKSSIPMILICNDRKLPKMKPFDSCTFALPFRRPTTDMIRSRIMTILYREGLKLPPNVVDSLIEGTGADIRQIVNMISTIKLGQQAEDAAAFDYDSGKQMSKAWEKSIVLRPWDIVSKILGGGMFASSSRASLNEKIELYFNDHEFSYLMLAENYLGTTPILANNHSGKDKQLKLLELADKAANSISEGDLVDRMIHGPEQQWSLMPTHAIMSFVKPASYMSGSMAGYGTTFPQWFGKNSTQNKLIRMVKEIQGHMRLRASGDRHEIRQQYVPSLWAQLIKKLEREGKEAVPEVIDLMDSYFLTKDDWDAILELGIGPMDQEKVKIESQTKSTFTRLYNAQSHPLPFMKPNAAGAMAKAPPKAKPDLEEAIDESDEGEVALLDEPADEEGGEDDLGADIAKDKYVKAPKKKKAAPAKGKGKRKAADDDDEEDEEDEKPAKKAKGKAAASKGKGKK